MTSEEMERAIQSLSNRQAKISSDIGRLKKAQRSTAAKIASIVVPADIDRREMSGASRILTEEMRERLDELALSNEVTRVLSRQVARLCH